MNTDKEFEKISRYIADKSFELELEILRNFIKRPVDKEFFKKVKDSEEFLYKIYEESNDDKNRFGIYMFLKDILPEECLIILKQKFNIRDKADYTIFYGGEYEDEIVEHLTKQLKFITTKSQALLNKSNLKKQNKDKLTIALMDTVECFKPIIKSSKLKKTNLIEGENHNEHHLWHELFFRDDYFDAELFKKHSGIDVSSIEPIPTSIKHKDAKKNTFYIKPIKMLNNKLLNSKYRDSIDINKIPMILELDDFFDRYRNDYIAKHLKRWQEFIEKDC